VSLWASVAPNTAGGVEKASRIIARLKVLGVTLLGQYFLIEQ